MKHVLRTKYKRLIQFILLPFILYFMQVTFFLLVDYCFFPVRSEITVEASHYDFDIDDFVKYNLKGELASKIEDDTFSFVGIKNIKVKVRNKIHTTKVNIIDTTAPVATIKEVTMYKYHELNIHSFYSNLQDASKVEVTYKKTPNIKRTGTKKVTLIFKDIYGNKSKYKTKLTVLKDKEAPILKGVKDVTVYIGKTISYKKGVKVIDNVDQNLSVNVDASKVNTTKVGDYPLIYSAIDLSNNKVEKEVTVHVKKYDIYAQADDLADEVLKKIIKKDMTNQEKVKAIYDYLVSTISIVGTHQGNITDYKRAAFDGLKNRRGDCTTYAGSMMLLLDRCNIKDYMVVKRNPIRILNHYWLLINTGDGYYHYDPYKRRYHLTDAKINQVGYVNAGYNYYQRDTSLYPSTPDQ